MLGLVPNEKTHRFFCSVKKEHVFCGDWSVIMIQLFVATVIQWVGHACSQLNAHHLSNIKHITILTSSCNAGRLVLLF